jgi:uncharacterized protein
MEVGERDGIVTFRVRVQPRGGATKCTGEWHEALRIRLAAPALEGRANEALRRFLASSLNVPLTAVRIASGERSRNKRIEIRGATAAQVLALARPPAAPDQKEHRKHAKN